MVREKDKLLKTACLSFICILVLFTLFTSCGVANKAAGEKQISRVEVVHYLASEQNPDSLIKQRIDSFYYNRQKKSYREVEMTVGNENPNRITSYTLYLTDFDGNGRMSKVESYYIPMRPDGGVVDSAQLIKGTGQAIQRWVYIYNDEGDRTETQYYGRDYREELRLMSSTMYSYDKKKNVVEERRYYNNKDSLQLRSLNKYSRKGYKTGKTQYTIRDRDTLLDMEILYKYNKMGDVEVEECINALGKVYSKKKYEYTYNDFGRWIKKLEYRNGKLYKVSERKLGYYGFNDKGMGVDAQHLVQNEVWWRVIPLIHAKGANGVFAVYLYDDGHFIEKNILQMSGKRYTRKGLYSYNPEDNEVYMVYTDRKHKRKKYDFLCEEQTLTRPLPDDQQPNSTLLRSLLSVRKLGKGQIHRKLIISCQSYQYLTYASLISS